MHTLKSQKISSNLKYFSQHLQGNNFKKIVKFLKKIVYLLYFKVLSSEN
jgi:hypothetical protein